VKSPPVNEERIDSPVLAAQSMQSNCTAQLTTLGDCAGQRRHAHIGGHASDDAVERSELEMSAICLLLGQSGNQPSDCQTTATYRNLLTRWAPSVENRSVRCGVA